MRDPLPAQIHHASIVMAYALHLKLIFKHENMTKRSLDPCIGALILHDGRVSVSLPKHFFFSQ